MGTRSFSPPGALVDCRAHDAPRVARGRPRRGRHGPDVRQPARRSRHPVLLRPGLHPRRARLRARRGRARRRGAGRAAAAGARRARGRGRRRARRDGASPPRASTAIRRRRCGSPGSPAPTARRRRRSSPARCSRARASPCGLLGTVKSVVGGVERAVVRTTPEAIDLQRTFREMLDAGDVGVRDGDLLARAGAQARGRDPRRRGGVHQPHAGPPRLPSDDGGLLPGQAAAVRVAADVDVRIVNADDAVRAAADRGVRLPLTFAIDARGRLPRGRRAHGRRRAATSSAVTPDGEFPGARAAPGPLQRAQRARPPGRRRGRWARRRTGSPASLACAATAPGRFQPVEAGQPFGVVVDYAHKPDALEQVLLAAREHGVRAADRGRRRRAATATAASGRSWARSRRGWPTSR